MCRITTTASPVSGADVRDRMEAMQLTKVIIQAVRIITNDWVDYRSRTVSHLLRQSALGLLMDHSEGSVVESSLGGADSPLFSTCNSSVCRWWPDKGEQLNLVLI